MGDMLVSFDFKSHGEREKNHVGLDKVGGSFLQSADLSAKTLAKVAPPTHVQTEPLHRSFLTGANRENRAPHVASTPFPPVGAFKQLERKYLSIFRFHRRLERVRRCFVSLFGHLPTKLLSGLAGSSPPTAIVGV